MSLAPTRSPNLTRQPWRKRTTTLRFRFLFSFFTIFLVATSALCASVYWMFGAALERRDQEVIRLKLNEVMVRYQRDGIEGLRRPKAPETNPAPFVINPSITNPSNTNPTVVDEPWTFVRVEGPAGKTVFEIRPLEKGDYDFKSLENSGLRIGPKDEQWLSLPKIGDPDDHLSILSRRLNPGFVLQVGKSSDEREIDLELLLTIFAGVTIPLLILGLAGSAWLSARSLKPIHRLIDRLKKMESGDLTARTLESRGDGSTSPLDAESQAESSPLSSAPLNSTDELEQLSQHFNRLFSRIDGLFQGMTNTVDHLAHDLRTPLTRLRGRAESLLSQSPALTPSVHQTRLEEMIEDTDSILALVNTVMEINETTAGLAVPTKSKFLVSDLIARTADLYQMIAEDKAIQLVVDDAPGLELFGDRTQTLRVFANLLDNALKYTPQGGSVTIRSRVEDPWIIVDFMDTGIGIAPENLPQIGNRLFRIDPSRSLPGLGLGISLVKAILAAQGGRLEIQSAVGKGSVFSAYFKYPNSAQ